MLNIFKFLKNIKFINNLIFNQIIIKINISNLFIKYSFK